MESLFKFVLQRPAVKKEKDQIIDLTQNSNYQAELAASIGKENPRKILKSASKKYVNGPNFIADVNDLTMADKVRAFKEKLDDLVKKDSITQSELKNAVKDTLGKTSTAILNDNGFKKMLQGLRDSILAIKHLPEQHQKPIEELSNALRDLELVHKIANDTASLTTGSILKKFRRRPLKLPSQSDLKSILTQREEDRKKREEEERKRRERLKKQITEKTNSYILLQNAIKEIMGIDHNNLESSPQRALEGFIPPKELRPLNIFKEEIQRKNTLGQLAILNIRTQIEKGSNLKNLATASAPTVEATQLVEKGRQFFTGVGEFRPISNLSTQFRFKVGTEKILSRETHNLLKERGLDITEMGVDKIVADLRFEMEGLSNELELMTQNQKTRSVKRIGNTMVITSIPKLSMWGHLSMAESFQGFFPQPIDFRVPMTKGSVTPSGIADLIIVKQQLKGYEGKDVAHIENVLKGELKSRNHRRYNQTIEENFTETETERVEERELESTDRFELSRETSKTIQTDASLKAGLSVSGSYGPTVSFSASAEGSLSTSKEEATKTASNFSKDVTQRSVEKLTERILQSNKIIVTNEVEETNTHSIDNTKTGATHISGVYQWVEKLYEAQMYNYGVRMMFDFMIPEPGAYIVEAMQKAHASVMEIEKPLAFTLTPNQITETNYNYWIHEYGAKGIVPPPEEYITKSLDYNAGGGDDKTDYYHSGIIQIDEGYRAVYASVGSLKNIWGNDAVVDVVIGRRVHRFPTGDWVWSTSLNNETDSIPFGVKTNEVSDLVVAVEVKCQRTQRAYKKWQLETHSKLMEAYQTKVADYEESLAALELQAGIEIEGKNPALNLEIMKDELKKHCISILTDQHYDLFDAIETGSNGLPQTDLYQNEAEGPYVRFFEQAFEWEHITWLTYPYFWGRKDKWEERIAFEDPDPLFNQFIKAGYCRGVVPVRPGFEGAVDHFLTFGEIWNGGPLPAISSDLYLPIADELAERLDRPGDEVPQGDPWEVRVPTNLVKLRADDALPSWQKDAAGNWVEQ